MTPLAPIRKVDISTRSAWSSCTRKKDAERCTFSSGVCLLLQMLARHWKQKTEDPGPQKKMLFRQRPKGFLHTLTDMRAQSVSSSDFSL